MSTEHLPDSDLPSAPEPPPPGVRVMAVVRWIILAMTALVALSSWYGYARADHAAPAAEAKTRYQCPMHPQIVQDHPGECPICHMDLVPIETSTPARPGSAPPAAPSGAPAVTTVDAGPSEHAGHVHAHGKAPAPASSAPTAAPASGSPPATTAGVTPEGLTSVHLTLDRIQSIGVRTAMVERRSVARPLRVTAQVTPTETGVSEVHVRTPGFVERVAVGQTGAQVGAGQPLLYVYSPEIFQAESELIAASEWTRVGDAGAASGGAGELSRAATSARRKLELLGMSAADITRVVETREPMRAIPIHALASGVVTKKNVVLGAYVTPEMALYEIQDLATVYVVADVFARDVAVVQKGMRARFTPSRTEGAPVDATVDLIFPVADPTAQTTRVRLTVKNPRGTPAEVRPGDFGTVELLPPPRDLLAVPRDALVDTGRATYVFVVGAGGAFEPRTVVVAGEADDAVLLSAGVAPQDRVVSGATFLIDSESRLRAAVQSAPADPHAGHR